MNMIDWAVDLNYTNRMICKENKYFIFDTPKTINYKYFAKKVLYVFFSCFYKMSFKFYQPKTSRNTKYQVSVCAIFKDEATYLKEWIEFHKIVGVEHFYLYNNFSSDNYKQVLAPYIANGDITLTDWPVPQGQMKAYADCVEKFKDETQWIGFIDLDEFVCPNKHDTVAEFLKPFINRPIVIMYWRYFGSSGLLERSKDSLVTEDFTSCWYKYADIGKCFYNTDYDYAADMKGNEWMHSRWGKCNSHKLPPVNVFDKICILGFNPVHTDKMPIQINHYLLKSYSEYTQKKHKGDACFALSNHDEKYFDEHEHFSQSADFHIKRYLAKLKLKMNGGGDNSIAKIYAPTLYEEAA